MRGALVGLFVLLAAAAEAQTDRRALTAEEAGAFGAVGRLEHPGGRFCSATLISAREVLTAAHCLYDPETGRPVALAELRFAPSEGRARGIGRAATAPGFALLADPRPDDLRTDIALLELEEPVATAEPFGVGAMDPAVLRLAIVSYAALTEDAPGINRACVRLGLIEEVLILGCGIEPGMSGAPVFAGEGDARRVVAVVSAMRLRNDGVVFGVSVLAAPWIAALRAGLAGSVE